MGAPYPCKGSRFFLAPVFSHAGRYRAGVFCLCVLENGCGARDLSPPISPSYTVVAATDAAPPFSTPFPATRSLSSLSGVPPVHRSRRVPVHVSFLVDAQALGDRRVIRIGTSFLGPRFIICPPALSQHFYLLLLVRVPLMGFRKSVSPLLSHVESGMPTTRTMVSAVLAEDSAPLDGTVLAFLIGPGLIAVHGEGFS